MNLPIFFACGSHYEVAYSTGKIFKSRIQNYYKEFTPLHKLFLPFYHSDKGHQICDGWLKVVQQVFPQYVEEMKGLSEGAEIPFEQVLLIHFRAELSSYLHMEQIPECSTIHVNYPNQLILAHNEDTSSLVKSYGYILSAQIKDSGEGFTAFCYPGTIPGNAFSFNKHGLVFGVNALYPQYIAKEATARQFLNRALLSAKNFDNAFNILKNEGYGAANGFSVNIGSISNEKERILWNYEVAPNKSKRESIVTTLSVKSHHENDNNSGYYCHFNMYDHSSVKEIPDHIVSSIHRKKRADELPPPQDDVGARTILGDYNDKLYPIYRMPSPTDSGQTVATGVFDLLKCELSVYVENPKNSKLFKLPIRLWD